MASSFAGELELSPAFADSCDFKFVGEGAANVVFAILVQAPSTRVVSELFRGKLLRVPKAGTNAHSYDELYEYWETAVKPLFDSDNLVKHQLVRLDSAAVIPRLNVILEQTDVSRRDDFRGSRVAMAKYGMLVEDMRPKPSRDVTIEFKPKWLAQSPNAPASAVRCRNCAREALRRHTEPSTAGRGGGNLFCPLDFLACSSSPVACSNILTRFAFHMGFLSTPQEERLAHWLQTNRLMSRLRAAQLDNDLKGALGADVEHVAQLQLAMTLRDCTCFVRIPADREAPVEAKLGDLDKKNAAAKLESWQEMERRLIEGGYYEGKEVPRQETTCLVERAVLS